MLMGTYEHRLDSKARLVLPAKIREKLGDVVVGTIGLEKCIFLYSETEWENFAGKIRNLDFYSKDDHRKAARAWLMNAHEMPIDNMRRVLLPQALREYAGLKQEVVVCGVNDHTEIWDKEKLDAIYKFGQDNLSELTRDMGF